MLLFETSNADEQTYIDPGAIIAIEGNGDTGTLVHLSGGQTILVDVRPSKIVAKMSEAGITIRVGTPIRPSL